MASIMDAFKTPTAPAPTAPTPGNIPNATGPTTAASQGTAPNGTLPVAAADGPAANPLDIHKNLWDTPTNADGTPVVPANTNLFTVDAKQIMEAAGKVDFSKVLKPEQLAAIKAGGDGAAAALAEMLNATAQSVYAQSAFATTKIVEDGIKRSTEANNALFAEKIKGLNLSEALKQENPVFSHPATAPILSAIQAQLTTKYPSATTAELKDMSMKYMENFAGAFAPKAEQAGSKGGKNEVDWSNFLD